MASESLAQDEYQIDSKEKAPAPPPPQFPVQVDAIPLEVHENGNTNGIANGIGSRHGSVRATSPLSVKSSKTVKSEKSTIHPMKDSNNNNNNVEFTVSGDEVSKIIIPDQCDVDLFDRDPQQINQHLQVAFADIFGEPHPTVFSFDFIWRASFHIFTIVKLWTYRILALFCALPAAVCWALYFACMAFCHIWCCVPCFRQLRINMHLARRFFALLTDCMLAPVCIAFGKLFSSIQISVVKATSQTDHQV